MIETIFIFIFGVSAFLLAYHYAMYPFIISILAKIFPTKIKYENPPAYSLPQCTIIMAAHNEAEVIEKKIRSVFSSANSQYIQAFFVGTDACTDNTNEIINNLSSEFPALKHVIFTQRTGKIGVINELVKKAQTEYLIFTDANILFTENLVPGILQSFIHPQIGLVETKLVKTGMNIHSISAQESVFTRYETFIKCSEAKWRGLLMGPSGACYAIRRNLFTPVPEKFLVDDFFVGLHILLKGYQAVCNPKAIVMEDSTHRLELEYKRKVRIASGNMQNLFYFLPKLLKSGLPLLFVFISHKLLRWMGPVFLLLLIGASVVLVYKNVFTIAPIFVLGSILLPFFEILLRLIGIHVIFLRTITHFYAMNIALLMGIIKYMRGIHSNVWQPTKRTIS